MAHKLIISKHAQEDFREAIYYYDNIDPELGNKFYEEIIAIYVKLTEHPQYYSFVNSERDSNVRDINVPTFPYVLVLKLAERTWL
ncbi:hypothetical protein CJD36_008780 [Flavipsychrobacter stenotrophus]|uniref:Type II toxin-antitoxin system RelE/ParE family toxin n=1 Tax=Flavipsychrobacter stenotrophus TaxID=2077091 RepID=A0A2S7SY84_9BACT|nr:type II toxin-antitoxin system RelE/ParE family toxin [Flavipsychrobacter stenotrophus]PQJ11879.1 hypothetical protein CJD36_008780 [Flavipsychrobacter stenotrophus]